MVDRRQKFSVFFSGGYLISSISIITFLLLWEFASKFELVNPVFIGSPSGAISSIPGLLANNVISFGIFESIVAILIGLSVSAMIGVALGLSAGIYKKLYYIIRPYIYALEIVPKLVILPLIFLWSGIGINSKIILIVLMTIFPIVTSTLTAVRDIDKNIVNMALSFGYKMSDIIYKIYLPASLTQILNSIRISINKAYVAVVIAEFYGIGRGFGYYISYFGNTYQVDKMIGIILILALSSATLTLTVLYIESLARKKFQ